MSKALLNITSESRGQKALPSSPRRSPAVTGNHITSAGQVKPEEAYAVTGGYAEFQAPSFYGRGFSVSGKHLKQE